LCLSDFLCSDVGVFKAMVEIWGPDFYKKTMLCGGSAGTLFALGISCGHTPEFMDLLYQEIAEKAKHHGTFYYGSIFMEESVRALVNADMMNYKLIEGRCAISTTAFYSHHRWHVSWTSNEDLIECAKSSCHIPLYCQLNRGIKGVLVVDGAYAMRGSDLLHGDDTLFVGIDDPLYTDITRDFTYSGLLTITTGQEYQDRVQSGYDAFMNWVINDKGKLKKKVGLRNPPHNILIMLWTLKCLEYILQLLLWLFYEIIFAFFKKTLAPAQRFRKLVAETSTFPSFSDVPVEEEKKVKEKECS
jgi:hypothetical protein